MRTPIDSRTRSNARCGGPPVGYCDFRSADETFVVFAGANIPIPPGRSVKQSRRSRVPTIRRSTRGSAGLAVLAPRSAAMRAQVSAGSGNRYAPRATYSAFRDIRIVGRLEITGARDGVEIDRAWRAVRSGLQATSIWAATDGISRWVGGTSDTSAAVMRELTNCAAKRAVGRGH
jgi:hypothetical protein